MALAIAAASMIALGIGADRFVSKAQAAETHELRASIDVLNLRLEEFNRRLSWLEGRESAPRKP